MKNERTEASDLDFFLQNIVVLRTEVAAVREQVEEREAGLKQRLNELEAKISSLKVECAGLRWDRKELDARVEKLEEYLRCALRAVLQQRIEDVIQMTQVFEAPLAKSLKRHKSDSRLEGVKVSNDVKTVLKNCNGGAH